MINDIALINLGCPKALVDAEQIIAHLHANGYQVIEDCHAASLVIVNTCGFINEAIDESLDAIGEALDQNPKVIVTGCLGTKSEIIHQRYPEVLAITGPHASAEVIALVKHYIPLNLPESSCLIIQPHLVKLTPPHYAYLKIAEGCNHHCSYCIIPKLRGSLVSRPLAEILQEAEKLVEQGVQELIIIAQDTAAYGADFGQPQLFLKLAAELGKFGTWIRFHYLYPYPYLDQLLPLMADHKILPYLDIPLQHANPRILQLMRRPAHRENILQRINLWRSICPELIIRSTFIVGFPSETEQEFSELLDFLKLAQLDRVGCFKFSKVTGALASNLPKQIADEIKEERYHRLMLAQQKISMDKLQQRIGQHMSVLIDEITSDEVIGRSYGDAPEIDGLVKIKRQNNKKLKPHCKIGEIIKVKIIAADEYDLFGEL